MNIKVIVRIGLTFLVVLVAPISFETPVISLDPEITIHSYGDYTSPLLYFWTSYTELETGFRINLFAIPFAFLVCLPGIVFSYKLSKWPEGYPLKKWIIGVLILSTPLFSGISLVPLVFVFSESEYWWDLYNQAYYGTQANIWAVFLMILLPLLVREASQLRFHSANLIKSQSSQISSPEKYWRMTILLGMFALFIPTSVIFYYGHIPWSSIRVNTSIVSSSWTFSQIVSGLMLEYRFYSSESLYNFTTISILLYIGFAYSVIRYLQGRSTKRRCLIIAIAGLIFPVLLTLVTISYPQFETAVLIPLPFLYILGFAATHFLEPLEIEKTAYQIELTHEAEDQVKVPLIYRIQSLFNKSGNQENHEGIQERERIPDNHQSNDDS